MDPVTSVAIGESTLMLARESGKVLLFAIPSYNYEGDYTVNFSVSRIALNCNSTRCSLMDKNGLLKLLRLEKRQTNQEPASLSIEEFERKDVWDFQWAKDEQEMFAIYDKTRLHIFKDKEAEEPINCQGCKFVAQ